MFLLSRRSFSFCLISLATAAVLVQSLKLHQVQVQQHSQVRLNILNDIQSKCQTILKPIAISFASACMVSVITPSDIIYAVDTTTLATTTSAASATDSTSVPLTPGKPREGRRTLTKLPSGVEYYDATVGTGNDVVKEGSSVQFQWVLRRSNGYFVDASSNYDNEPFIYKVGNTKKIIKGLDEAIRGMKLNGVRQINVPPRVAYVEGVGDDKPGPMPAGFGPRRQITTRQDREVWYFEIKVTKIKNS